MHQRNTRKTLTFKHNHFVWSQSNRLVLMLFLMARGQKRLHSSQHKVWEREKFQMYPFQKVVIHLGWWPLEPNIIRILTSDSLDVMDPPLHSSYSFFFFGSMTLTYLSHLINFTWWSWRLLQKCGSNMYLQQLWENFCKAKWLGSRTDWRASN